MPENTYQQAEQIYTALASQQKEGGADINLPPIQLSHFPIYDTGLAACLGTLGVPFREPAPFTDDIEESTGRRRTCFWMGDHAPAEDPADQHKTEEICTAWEHRARFEADYPMHPLVSMRAVLDARAWWVAAIHNAAFVSPRTNQPDAFLTPSLREASLLKALGFRVLAFTGRAFILEGFHKGVPAKAMLEGAAKREGGSPAQWMHRVAENFDHLLAHAKKSAPIIRIQDGNQTLMLTADATTKTRDKFHALLS